MSRLERPAHPREFTRTSYFSALAGNVYEIEAESAAGRFAITLQGKPSRTNPKTSALAALSVARALLNEAARIVV